MDTEVISTLLGVDNVKDTSYVVSLSVGDNVLVGYDAESDTVTGTVVGGEGTTGLEELNKTLPEYPLVATLKPGETADVVLKIQPDAEQTDNAYISSLGRVEFRFKVSDVPDESVVTGDDYIMYIAIAVIAVGLILFFVLALVVNTYLLDGVPQLGAAINGIARKTLTITMFFIGASLSIDVLKAVGIKPLIQGILLWIIISLSTLAYIYFV